MHFPVPDPKHSQIAQVYSGSTDQGAPSPLLTIAPELRNQIYEYLLVDYHPITVKNASYRSTRKIGNFGGSPAVLRTCRQIYHETVGLLYSKNTFRFEYNIHHDMFKVKIISPIDMSKGWIDDIGSCLPRLRTIKNNMDVPDMPEKYEEWMLGKDVRKNSRQPIDVLPLLEVLWNSNARDTSVMFEMAEDDASDGSESDFEEQEHDATSIANILFELGENDAFDLQKTRRLLESALSDLPYNVISDSA